MLCVSAGLCSEATSTALCHKVQGPVESSFSVHVLPVLSFQNDVHSAHVVPFDLLALGSIEAAETHHPHHLLLLWCLPLEISLCDYGTLRCGGFRFGFRPVPLP